MSERERERETGERESAGANIHDHSNISFIVRLNDFRPSDVTVVRVMWTDKARSSESSRCKNSQTYEVNEMM